MGAEEMDLRGKSWIAANEAKIFSQRCSDVYMRILTAVISKPFLTWLTATNPQPQHFRRYSGHTFFCDLRASETREVKQCK